MYEYPDDARPEYDSDDMSPGARLMRYYVSDDPRPDLDVKSTSRATVKKPRQNAIHVSEERDLINANATGASSAEIADTSSLDQIYENGDDATFARDLEELRRDLLWGIAGRHAHRTILAKIKQFHPNDQFDSKDLTWRLAYTIKSRARQRGTTRPEERDELDAIREANGVASTKKYRTKDRRQYEDPKVSGQMGEVFSQNDEIGRRSELEDDDYSWDSPGGQFQAVRRSSRAVVPVVTNAATLAELESFLSHASRDGN